MQCLRCQAQGLQILRALTIDNRTWYIHQRLRQLAHRNGGNHSIRSGVDRLHCVTIFQPHINPAPIVRAPDAVGQIARRNGGHLLWWRAGIAPVDEHLVAAANRYVSEPSHSVRYESNVVGNRICPNEGRQRRPANFDSIKYGYCTITRTPSQGNTRNEILIRLLAPSGIVARFGIALKKRRIEAFDRVFVSGLDEQLIRFHRTPF